MQPSLSHSANSFCKTSIYRLWRLSILGIGLFSIGHVFAGTNESALYIDEKGNIGIGTQQPLSILAIKGKSTSDAKSIMESTANNGLSIETGSLTNNGFLSGIVWTAGNNRDKPAAGIWAGIDPAKGSRLYLGTSNQLATGIGNPAITIKEDGNVGINAIEPQGFQVQLPENSRPAAPNSGVTMSGGEVGNASIELRNKGTGTPYIDFAQSTTADYDARIRLTEPGKLAIEGATILLDKGEANALQVKQRLKTIGRLQVDDNAETTYEVTDRYHLSLSSKYRGRTKTIPQDVLVALCGDPDGCQIRIGMTRWVNENQTAAASRSFLFYYGKDNGHWRADDEHYTEGIDGNGLTQHVIDTSSWHTCYFTDAIYENSQDKGDKEKGMQLLWWAGGYNTDSRTCELTLID